MGPRGIALVRTAADPTFRDITPPSTTGEPQKVPRNLTKLGHRTGRSGLASVIWVNAGLPAARTRLPEKKKPPATRSRDGRLSIGRGGRSGLGLSVRTGTIAALRHELIEFGFVFGHAQPIEELVELALLVLEPANGLGPILVEGAVAARRRVK